MGSADRVSRTIGAVVIAILLLTGAIEGIAGTILGLLAVAFLATSAMGYCPLYQPLKISTLKEK